MINGIDDWLGLLALSGDDDWLISLVILVDNKYLNNHPAIQ